MMIRELAPTGLRGLLLVTFAAAFMSTISTQMNWGASYLVNDVYKRFIAPDADDRQLLRASRLASGLVLLLGGAVAWWMLTSGVSVDQAWAFLAALGAGVGAVFILRWFWWRINVWSEITAMVGSLVLFAALTPALATAEVANEYRALIVASGTLVLWLMVTAFTRPTERDHLDVLPQGPPGRPRLGPGRSRGAGRAPDGALGRGLLRAVLGTAIVWLTLPGIGSLIFGEYVAGLGLLAAAAACGVALLKLAPRSAAA